jgi:hypothetical protein
MGNPGCICIRKAQEMTNLSSLIFSSLVFGLAIAGCSQQQGTTPTPPAVSEQQTTPSGPPKHYTDGQEIPGVGRAIGDVYFLPSGQCYGEGSHCGIQWKSGSTMIFAAPEMQFQLLRPGSPEAAAAAVP